MGCKVELDFDQRNVNLAKLYQCKKHVWQEYMLQGKWSKNCHKQPLMPCRSICIFYQTFLVLYCCYSFVTGLSD